MYHILISLGVTLVVTLLFGWLLDFPKLNLWYGILPGLFAGVGVFIWRSRLVMKDMEAIMNEVQQVLSVQPRPVTSVEQQKAQQRKMIDNAVGIIRRGDRWRKWQPLVGPQLDGQIGMLYYTGQRFKEAEPLLKASTPRNPHAFAMLACLHYRRNELDAMNAAFERAVKHGKKESLIWNTWAWCLEKKGRRDEAIAVLNRGLKALPGEERTQRNLTNLSNNREMKMKPWEPMWFQFHLEKPQQQMMQQTVGRQRVDRRSVFRGR